ncbi:hypothetical protein NC652_034780 [Populus alba x Populus x berolinensis]|nr:hypothetical protein NC652_034780 [Populus alba x Populus x berolinensis]
MFGLWEISSGCCSTIGKNFVLARFVASGYWIFIPFILFHFIGLVAAVVLGFVRVPMLSRHVISIVAQLSPRCRKLKHYIFPISLEL